MPKEKQQQIAGGGGSGVGKHTLLRGSLVGVWLVCSSLPLKAKFSSEWCRWSITKQYEKREFKSFDEHDPRLDPSVPIS